MARGTVKFFNEQKGYGFIVPIGKVGITLPDVFVHMSAVENAGLTTLSEGQVVEYTLVEHRGRTQAENLKLLATPKR
jgi:CspA family cold shock protein